jgi:ferritin
MLSKKMLEALEEQINKEIYSGYFYLGMSAYAAFNGLPGVANWFYGQWKEELEHAKKMFDYAHKAGNRVTLKAIDVPPQDFSSAADLFEKTLNHEKKVTGLINNLVDVAKKENDKATEDFLQWFVKEQKEEEATPATILKRIQAAGSDASKFSEVDQQLARRK